MNSPGHTTRFLLFLVAAVIVSTGCGMSFRTHKDSKFRTVTCNGIKKEGKTAYLVDPGNTFEKGQGKKVYVFTEWFDLEPGKKYVVRWEWYAPDGRIISSGSYTTTPKDSYWKTWGWMSLDPEDERPPGRWTVKVFLNNYYKEKLRFTVAESPAATN
ncbi:MAG: hypothetical protein V3W31_06850 [Thermodesulfobacteriota bacterium]